MRACWLKWVGRDWSISADYIWLNYSGANNGLSHQILYVLAQRLLVDLYDVRRHDPYPFVNDLLFSR